MILSVDPGETSGWAAFHDDGAFVGRGQLPFDEMMLMIAFGTKMRKILAETYTHDPGRQKRGSTFKTVQIIGALKLRALQLDAEFVTVSREAKGMGAIYSGEEPPANHKLSHQVDAKNLGIYWLVEQGIIDPPSMSNL